MPNVSFIQRASRRRWLSCAAVSTVAAAASAGAQEATPYATINAAAAASPIKVTTLRGKVSVLEGSGGNIAVLAGKDGIFLIDTGIAVSKDKILAAIAPLGRGPIRYAVNTHWHWDHTDGNGWVRASGAVVASTSNTAQRLSQTIRVEEWKHTFTPVPQRERPNRKITQPTTVRLNGESITIRPYVSGHTDGDLSVYFPKADVLAVGDTWWNGQYPFIDYVAGGSIDGAIRLANRNVELAKPTTLVIPGHGPVGGRKQLVEFRDMLVAIRSRVAGLKKQGMSAEDVVKARPSADFDGKWGNSIIDGALFTRLVYRGV